MALVLIHRGSDEAHCYLGGVLGRYRICAKAENIRSIVLTRKNGCIGGGAEGCSDVLETVGAHAHADAAAADKDAEIGNAGGDFHCHLYGVVGIVGALGCSRTHIVESSL